jgi:GNAT superfamily N-acetyltransferase
MNDYTLELIDLSTDIDGIVALHRRDIGGRLPNANTPLGWYRMGGPWMEPRLATSYLSEMLEHEALIWVVKRQGNIIAEMEVEPLSPRDYFLNLLLIDPDQRHSGLGTQILQQLVEHLRLLGGRRLITCPEKGVEPFYRRNRFRLFARRCRVEGSCASGAPVKGWLRAQKIPDGLPMLFGHNQPEQHHMHALFMRYFRILSPARKQIDLLTRSGMENDLIVGLDYLGHESSTSVWIFVWSNLSLETVYQHAVVAPSKVGTRKWFTYLAEKEADAFNLITTDYEEWWERSIY